MAFVHTRIYLAYFILSIFHVIAATSPTSPLKDVTDCSCGYYDHTTHNLFTESTIVYFNETAGIPVDTFIPQIYENSYEKGWNTQYRQGANASNVRVGRDLLDGASNTSLELSIDPPNPAHLVVGGGVQTARKDIFYGSFRMLLRSPGALGSSLSMTLNWNETQGITTNIQSTDDYSTAWVSTLSGDEFSDRKLGVNYTVLSNSSNNISPWDYTEYRVDWTPKQVNWTIGGKLFRQLNKTPDNKFPQTPVSLVLKHWSVGNYFSMQGPPLSRSAANVGWVRLFFNSSLATDEDRQDFVLRCKLNDACAMDDIKLRGASSYDPAATLKWKQIQKLRDNKEVATAILIICGTISFFLIIHALARRLPWEKVRRSRPALHVKMGKMIRTSPHSQSVGLMSEEAASDPQSTVPSTPQPLSRRLSSEVPSVNFMTGSQEDNSVMEQMKPARLLWREYSNGVREARPYLASQTLRPPAQRMNGDKIMEAQEKALSIEANKDSGVASGKHISPSATVSSVLPTPDAPAGNALHTNMLGYNRSPTAVSKTTINVHSPLAGFNAIDSKVPNPTAPSNLPAVKQRVDYLAGLVAISCMLVTAIHFCLTFAPAAINPGAYIHYKSEVWARKTIDSYFLNLIWIGPFLMTSTRFLVSNYLKNGNLSNIAEKVVGRPFRLLIPILAIAILEYFLMDSGATEWLESLPSVTWSTWPFTTVPDNFGHFISEILELAYLIPNAAPQITFNYCTGVLWTIPVQLQGSWVTLLAVIVIREIKKPWKRAGFYTFCILMHWYALSWGTFFYLAILLTDLDITYKYRKWLSAHKAVYYPLIILCALFGFGGLSLDMISQWTNVNYATYEYGIHPDMPTGLPIMLTGGAGYPQYYVPKAHGIIFSVGFQALIELSPLVQKLFSFKFLIYVFPHIFTIYLIHGFIFWSIGSTICVYLAGRGIPYWLNILIVAICCYATLFASLPLLTPIVETLGKRITANIWEFASEKPAPRRPTLFPFPNDFLFVRQLVEQEDEQKGKQPTEDIVTRKPLDSFRRFIASVATSVDPHFTNRQSQSTDLASTCTISRSESAGGRAAIPRNVGWRTGRLSGNVEVLRRNNSSAKDKK